MLNAPLMKLFKCHAFILVIELLNSYLSNKLRRHNQTLPGSGPSLATPLSYTSLKPENSTQIKFYWATGGNMLWNTFGWLKLGRFGCWPLTAAFTACVSSLWWSWKLPKELCFEEAMCTKLLWCESSDRKEAFAEYNGYSACSLAKYLYSTIVFNLPAGNHFETPPIIGKWHHDTILIWQSIHNLPNHQVKFPAKYSSYTVCWSFHVTNFNFSFLKFEPLRHSSGAVL